MLLVLGQGERQQSDRVRVSAPLIHLMICCSRRFRLCSLASIAHVADMIMGVKDALSLSLNDRLHRAGQSGAERLLVGAFGGIFTHLDTLQDRLVAKSYIDLGLKPCTM